MSYQVIVERAQDPSPEALQRTVEAIARQFGIPTAALMQRMQKGRFSARTGLDKQAAIALATQLESCGAVCTVSAEAAPAGAAQPASVPTPPAAPAPTAATALGAPRPPAPAPVALSPSLPSRPQPVANTALGTPVPSMRPASPEDSGEYHSGLAAAFSSGDSDQDLGALTGADGPGLRLSTIDGDDEPPPASTAQSFAPADVGEAPRLATSSGQHLAVPEGPPSGQQSIAPAPAAGTASGTHAAPPQASPSQPSVDPFLPPEMTQPEELELAVAPIPRSGQVAAAAPPPGAQFADGPGDAMETAQLPSATRSASFEAQEGAKKKDPREVASDLWFRFVSLLSLEGPAHFATGLILAVFIGFLPAHLVASSWEGSAFAEIHSQLNADYEQFVEDRDAAALERLRDAAVAAKYAKRRTVAFVAFLLWLFVAIGIGYAWFRVIDWARLRPLPPPGSTPRPSPAS